MQRRQIKKYISSPLNYIGGKARILDQILPLFPQNIDILFDMFCGGGNVGMNVNAKKVIYNDISEHLIGLFKTFMVMENETIINNINALIKEFGFSETRNYNFAYYGGDANLGVSKYNRKKFLKLRERFNNYSIKDNQYYILLYTLILFGFNNQIRFNEQGKFNLPVGKRDFNTTIENKFRKFFDALRKQNCEFSNKDFRKADLSQLTNDSLVYCDPPYLITTATYNEKNGWTVDDEKDLLQLLDSLNRKNIKFALSNVLMHEGKKNDLLIAWIEKQKYIVHNLFMDYHYSNYQKKTKKADSQEVLITNF